MAELVIDGLECLFGGFPAIDGVSLTVADGEFVAVLGPSGCGKSTLLRLIAGFERPSAGRVAIGGRTVAGSGHHVPPEDRRVGIVFQSYALWPHMTVEGNVGYPLDVARVRGGERRRRIGAALSMVGLAGFEARRPAELSGGQRQRVALARCLVMEPSLVLLDEPLANLDAHLRAAMEEEFSAFHAGTGATMVYVTHDQAEAMSLADRIAVMDHGRIVQAAAPRDLYREPATRMVAGFVGKGGVVEAMVLDPPVQGHARVRLLGTEAVLRCRQDQAPGPAHVCLRPEDLAPDPTGGVRATVRRVAFQGATCAVEVAVGVAAADARAGGAAVRLPLSVPAGAAPEGGREVRLAIRGGWVIPAA